MELHVKQIRQETPTTISLIFDKPLGFDFTPGQFLRWTFPLSNPDARGNSRSFSLSSSPTEEFIMMTTRIGPSSLKQSLSALTPGTVVKAIGPMGKFVLDEGNSPLVFVSGGVGITPFRSMLKYLIDTKSNRSVTLLYSNKMTEEIIYQKELAEWSRGIENVKIVLTITDSGHIPSGWMGEKGRIDEGMIKKHAADLPHSDFYACGPPVMVEAMVGLLREMHIDEQRIHAEVFSGY